MHPDQMTNHWNYSDEDPLGPSEWPKYFETGDSQSPINIIVDHCYLHLHSSTNSTTMTPMMTTKPAGSRGKLVAGMVAARRDHLDSVGDDLNNSPQYSPDLYDDNHLNVHHHHHHDRRSPSASSNNSSVSNESNTSNEPTTEHSGAHHHNRHHHHHHERHHERHRRHQQHHSAYQRDDDSLEPRQHHQTEHRLCHHGAQAPAANTQNTRYCGTNKKIFLGYPRYLNAVKISNTGHGWQIDMPAELAYHTLLTGPPLGDREYRLAQFHCHWGEDCEHGSEHQVNGQGFSAEIHFVHWNCKQFKSIEEASKHKHGLAVLGVFIQALEGEQNRNKHLDKIIAGLEEVQDRPHNSTLLSDIRLDLKKLFPSNRWNYATYEGSLTTPPLSECVDWLVFLQPITCSSSQIDQFRRIKCPTGTLTKNCRPVQPVNKRIVTIWTHHSDNPNN